MYPSHPRMIVPVLRRCGLAHRLGMLGRDNSLAAVCPLGPVSKPNSPLASSPLLLYQLLHENTLKYCPAPLCAASLRLLPNNWTNTAWLSQTQTTELVQCFKRLSERPVPLTQNLSREIHEKVFRCFYWPGMSWALGILPAH